MDSIQEKWQGSKLYQEQASSPAICPWNAHAQILSTSRDSQRTPRQSLTAENSEISATSSLVHQPSLLSTVISHLGYLTA